MASLRMTGATYTVCFRLGGVQLQRSLRTADRRRAETLLAEIDGRLGRLALGEKRLPAGVDPVEFAMTGRDEPPARPAAEAEPVPSFAAAAAAYVAARRGVKADATVVTERIHLANVGRELAALRPAAAAASLAEIDRRSFDRALQFARGALDARRVRPCAALGTVRDGAFVTVAGLVLLRQRPGSAKGIVFMTLEDETGAANLVVHPDVWQKFRRPARAASTLLVSGRVQRDEAGTTHLVAARLADLSETIGVAVRARDFH